MNGSEWTPELYEHWKTLWQVQHPNQVPPTWEQFEQLVGMFKFQPETFGL